MNVITIESEAFQTLIKKIDNLSEFVDQHADEINEEEAWVDSNDVCNFLNISLRTLQRWRTTKEISYSLLGNKTFYKISDIRIILETKRMHTQIESMDDLRDAYKERIEKIKQ